jgi:hypothetical protein
VTGDESFREKNSEDLVTVSGKAGMALLQHSPVLFRRWSSLMTNRANSLKAMLVRSPPIGRAHDPLSRNLYQRSGGGTGRGADDYRRRLAAVFCAGLVMATGLPALAEGVDGSAGGSPSAGPTAEAAATDQSLPLPNPNTAVQWVGMFGVLLLLARGAFRR